jgi:O-antigen/teichoic acid export membrane protein
MNASMILLGDIGFRILGFIASVHLATTLGGAAFGLVTVGFSWLTYAQSLADLGISILGTRETARPHETREFQPAEILVAKIVLAAAVYPIAVALLYLIYDDPASRDLIHLFFLSLIPYALLVEWLHQGARNYAVLTAGKLLSGVVWAGGIILFVDSDSRIDAVPILYLASYVATAALLFVLGRRQERLVPTRIDWSVIGRLIRRGATIGAASILGLSVLVLPPLVVERLGTAVDAGVLGATLKVVTIFLAADRLFVALFLPAISGSWRAPGAEMNRRLETTFKAVLILGGAVGVTLGLFAGHILGIIYGDSIFSREGAPILAIIGWFIAATLVNSFVAYTLVGLGEERAYLKANLMSGPIVVAAIVVGTLLWGLPGTALAIVLGEMIITLFLYPYFRRHVDVAVVIPLLLTIALSALTVGTGYALGDRPLWHLPLYLLAFTALAAVMLGVGRDDLRWLERR